MLNHHLTSILAHERERELREARAAVAIPRELGERDERIRPRATDALPRPWRLRRAQRAQLCSDLPACE